MHTYVHTYHLLGAYNYAGLPWYLMDVARMPVQQSNLLGNAQYTAGGDNPPYVYKSSR